MKAELEDVGRMKENESDSRLGLLLSSSLGSSIPLSQFHVHCIIEL